MKYTNAILYNLTENIENYNNHREVFTFIEPEGL